MKVHRGLYFSAVRTLNYGEGAERRSLELQRLDARQSPTGRPGYSCILVRSEFYQDVYNALALAARREPLSVS